MVKKKKQKTFAQFPRRHSRAVLFLDTTMLILGIIGPITGSIQAWQIFAAQDAGSVSLISWAMFLFANAIAFTYGVVHRLLPIIVSNAIWVLVDILVVVGIIIHS